MEIKTYSIFIGEYGNLPNIAIELSFISVSTTSTRLLKPMVLEAGQHFTIRDHGGTIGTGLDSI